MRATATSPGLSIDLETQLQQLISSPTIPSNCISRFIATQNLTTGGVDVGFTVANVTGISAVTLLRASVMDASVATMVQSWNPATVSAYTFPDASGISGVATAYYWLRLEPQGTSGTAVLVGPQTVDLNPDKSSPAAPTSISVSHDAVSNGTIRLYANVSGVPEGSTIRISVAGYQGNAGYVSVASVGSSPAQFVLQATGETITVVAQSVSGAGIVSDYSPAATVTLDSSRTPPAAPPIPDVVQFSGGNQLTWRSSAESWVTGYKVYRSTRLAAFGTATVIATVVATSEANTTYTDTAGLTGDYQYFIVAQSTAGDSLPSDPGFPTRTYSATTLPPNVAANQTNDATVDSVSAGPSALIRVYGPGGVGTGYTRTVGSASFPRPNGTISGNSFNTQYAVVYDTVSQAYLSYLMTSYPATLPDEYEFVGYYKTVSTGSAPGSGATAVAVVSGGYVVQVNMTANGSGYQDAQFNFSGGGGSGAQAKPNISTFGGSINSATVTSGGDGLYATAPSVTVVAIDPGTQPGGGGASTIYAGGARYANDPSVVNG